MKILSENKSGLFNYTIIDKYEAGIVLQGHEVKSVKDGQAQLKGAYVSIDQSNQMQLLNCHIPKYPKASQVKDYTPTHPRKLLLNKNEIYKIKGQLSQKGLTLVPVSIYIKGSRVKVSIGLAKSKKKSDKKAAIKERDISRNAAREAYDYLDK